MRSRFSNGLLVFGITLICWAPVAARDVNERFVTGPNARVDISNVSGSVRVDGWDRQEAFDTALEHGLKALEIAADDPSTHYLLALLRGSRGENEEALAHYDKAVALNPSASRYLAASATPLLNVCA